MENRPRPASRGFFGMVCFLGKGPRGNLQTVPRPVFPGGPGGPIPRDGVAGQQGRGVGFIYNTFCAFSPSFFVRFVFQVSSIEPAYSQSGPNKKKTVSPTGGGWGGGGGGGGTTTAFGRGGKKRGHPAFLVNF